jgi:cytochrome c biogenesis factor
MIKTIVIIAFILIIISLGSALFHLFQSKTGEQSEEQAKKTVKALTLRITLSMILFIFVFIMVATGLYKPQGIGAGMVMHKPVMTENNK